jgi:hypothetical protein
MKRFNKTWKIGDFVKIIGSSDKEKFQIVEIHETRNWIKISGISGSFQQSHVKKVK